LNNKFFLSTRSVEFTNLISGCKISDHNQNSLEIEEGINIICHKLLDLRNGGSSLYVLGNGGSAGVASHAVTDFFNVAKLRATTLHESSLLTCMANDFGYENAYARMLRQLVKSGDAVIAISSSGNSMNIRNAAKVASDAGCFVVTLTGFSCENPLRFLGDINIWLDSTDYGFVEIGHQFLLHYISDRFGAGLVCP
jgi:D-sedoheptulose 7-phosphate isomerase